jgi:hypothetical protein
LKKVFGIFKVLILTYIVGFAITAAHLPTTVKRGIIQAQPGALLVPLTAIAIVRTYLQFLFVGVWPFEKKSNDVGLDDVIVEKRHGRRDTITYEMIAFEILNSQKGSGSYLISREAYQQSFYGASYTVGGGGLLRIGRYFCFMSNDTKFLRNFTAPAQCYELMSNDSSRYSIRLLGKQTEQEVRFSSLP